MASTDSATEARRRRGNLQRSRRETEQTGSVTIERLPEVTTREAEVLTLVVDHLTNREIAERLYISERTVESHVSSLLRKLGVDDRRALARHRLPATPTGDRSAMLPPAIELLADPARFVGRSTESDALDEVWRLARSGHTLAVFVTGEPGIGKSRLVSEFATRVHADGGRVLLGACYEDVDDPYGPFVQAIVAEAASLPDEVVRQRAGDHGHALRRLAPALDRALEPPGEPTPPNDGDGTERRAVLDAIATWLETGAATTPLLVVVEDLHWSTSTTRDVLRHLVRRSSRVPLLIATTARDSKPDLDAHLAAMLAELQRSPAVTRLALHGLDQDEVAALSGTDAPTASAILAETRGNPLLVTHMTDDVHRGSLPIWLYQRDQLLDGDARAVLDQAATFGREFDADLLAAAQGEPLLAVLEHLEAAEAAGLVVPIPGRPAGFAFVHALFRSHRYRALSPRRRLQLHARAATALATRPDDVRLAAERARHACLALPLIDAREAVELAQRAARHDELSYAYDEAVAHYRRALGAARTLDPPEPAITLDLTIRIGAALHHGGDPAGLPMLLEAGQTALATGDTPSLVRAATAVPQFGAVGFVEPMAEGRALTEAALEAIGDAPTAERASLLMDLASHWLFVSVDGALDLARRAEAVARELGDPDVLGSVLLAARHLYSCPARIDERVRIASELEVLGRQLGRLAFTLAGLATNSAALLERGDLGAWSRGFERFCDLLGDRQLAFFQLQALTYPAHRAFLAGDLDEAEALAALTVPLSTGIGAGRVYAESTVVSNRRLQDRDDELVARYERAVARSSDGWYRCSLAAVQARSWRTDAARITLDALRAEAFPIREIYPWPVAVTELAEASELVGDADVARHVLTVAGPFSGRLAVGGPCPNRPFDQALAQAALGADDAHAAVSYATRAVAASRHRHTPAFLARELVFLAEARRRTGESVTAVGPLVDEALELAERTGAAVVATDVARYGLRA